MPGRKHVYKVGDTFSRWTIISMPERYSKDYTCICRCDCGNEKVIERSNLRSGKSKSCGCLAMEMRTMIPMRKLVKLERTRN
jgi:hypothetical protein